MSKPIIAIACRAANCIADPQANIPTRNELVMLTYAKAVERAGGLPVLLPSVDNPDDYRYLGAFLDGILLPGGADVAPQLYGETPEGVQAFWPEVDALDSYLVATAIRQKIPLFGICRGMQIINIVCGGKMFQDLGDRNELHEQHHKPRNSLAHEIKVLPGSLLQAALGIADDSVEVNSLHHQACSIVCPPLIVSAKALDGVIEAIEMPRYLHPFALGVQCHPEEITDHPNWRKVFEAFVKTAQEYRHVQKTADADLSL